MLVGACTHVPLSVFVCMRVASCVCVFGRLCVCDGVFVRVCVYVCDGACVDACASLYVVSCVPCVREARVPFACRSVPFACRFAVRVCGGFCMRGLAQLLCATVVLLNKIDLAEPAAEVLQYVPRE